MRRGPVSGAMRHLWLCPNACTACMSTWSCIPKGVAAHIVAGVLYKFRPLTMGRMICRRSMKTNWYSGTAGSRAFALLVEMVCLVRALIRVHHRGCDLCRDTGRVRRHDVGLPSTEYCYLYIVIRVYDGLCHLPTGERNTEGVWTELGISHLGERAVKRTLFTRY